VPGSQASGKVANCEVGTEARLPARQVSQTAVSVLILRLRSGQAEKKLHTELLGRMRYHMLPKSKAMKGDSTEIRTERKENVQRTY